MHTHLANVHAQAAPCIYTHKRVLNTNLRTAGVGADCGGWGRRGDAHTILRRARSLYVMLEVYVCVCYLSRSPRSLLTLSQISFDTVTGLF